MKKYFRSYRPSIRLGKHGHPMRDPEGHDYDLTSDLMDAPVPQNASGAEMQTPPGAQPVFGDAKPVHQTPAIPDQDDKAQKEPNLRDQLSNAFKTGDNKPTDQQNAQTADQKPTDVPALTKDSAGKYRQPDGTFASAEQVAAFEAAQAGTNNQQQQSPVLQGLTPVEAQQFQSLPAELRQFVERTMEGLNTRGQRYAEYDMLEQHLIGPRREAWAQQGMNPTVAMNQLFALSDFATQSPGEFALWFAQQHNLDLDALQDARDAAQQNVDPALRQLQGQVQQLTGTVQQFQQGQQAAAQQANVQMVENWAQEKDQSGNLLRPHLTDVLDGWMAQITAVKAAYPNMSQTEVLAKAYENACWADPTVRGKMQQAEREKAQQAEAARVAQARAAGASVTGAPAGSYTQTPNNSNTSLRDELQQAIAQYSV